MNQLWLATSLQIMKSKSILIATIFSVLASLVMARDEPQKIAIIKADDVRGVSSSWKRFFAISQAQGVKVSAGVICNSLPGGSKDYLEWLRLLDHSGQVEFWNHGWDHKRWTNEKGVEIREFDGSGIQHQKRHYEDSQAAMKRVFGRGPIAFGAPYNAVDADTARIMNGGKNMRLYFGYKDKGVKSMILAPMILRGEHDGTGKPDFGKFKAAYLKEKDVAFTAIQFHPTAFSEEHFGEYTKILDFLQSEGWVFMLPSEYVAMHDAEKPATRLAAGDARKGRVRE